MPPLRAVVLTALREEYDAVKDHLANISERIHDQGTVYQVGNFFAATEAEWEVCLAEIGAGNASAAQETERAIAFFTPNVAMFVGVAGGLKDVSIGDIVVATKVYSYESGKAEDDFLTRPEARDSSYRLEQRARAEARNHDWTKRLSSRDNPNTRVYLGPIASGEKVVASSKSAFYRFVRQHYGDALVVEMEGSGFLEAARSHSEVQAIVIRGISDLIDGKSEADAKGTQAIAARNASAFAFELLSKYHPPGWAGTAKAVTDPFRFQTNVEVENLIKVIALGDWDTSADTALRVLQYTSPDGDNTIFAALLRYYDCPNEDLRWAAFQTVESAVALAPDLIDRKTLTYFATHPDFSVRASAASICMELANFAPSRVPIDLLIPLSVHTEDWYVQAPANAALKTLAHSMPAVMRIFINRLHSDDSLEREHGAATLVDVARTEPELLEPKQIRNEIKQLNQIGDKKSSGQLTKILPNLSRTKYRAKYRYGL